MKITVEVRVEPKPRIQRPVLTFGSGNGSAAENPSRTPFGYCCFNKRVTRETAPTLQLRPNAFFITDNCNQISWTASAHDGNQFRQKARGECLTSNIEIDIRFHGNGCILARPQCCSSDSRWIPRI